MSTSSILFIRIAGTVLINHYLRLTAVIDRVPASFEPDTSKQGEYRINFSLTPFEGRTKAILH